MTIDIIVTADDIISYIIIFTAAFIGGFIGVKIGCLSARISLQHKMLTRDDVERRMDIELNKELPCMKNKVEHRDPRLED